MATKKAFLVAYNLTGTTGELSDQISFSLTLTGDADSTTDIELPLASYQARLVNAAQSSHFFYLPYTPELFDQITARRNGDLIVNQVITYADGSTTLHEFARANFSYLSKTIGSSSSSLKITGYKQVTNQSPRVVENIEVVDWGLSASQKRMFALLGNAPMIAGDFFEYDGDTIEIGVISILISPRRFQYTVTEA